MNNPNPNLKTCSRCNISKDENSNFYNRPSRKGTMSWCKDCFNLYTNLRHMEKKYKAIDYLGGKCMDCGIDNTLVLEFHHRDPNVKDSTVTGILGRKWDRLIEEIEKCDLICANCHRIRHASYLSDQLPSPWQDSNLRVSS